MKLTVVTPQHKNEYTVEWIEGHTPVGNIIVLPGHAPLIMTLIAGSDLSFLLSTGEKKRVKLLRSGFLEVNRASALALINQEADNI